MHFFRERIEAIITVDLHKEADRLSKVSKTDCCQKINNELRRNAENKTNYSQKVIENMGTRMLSYTKMKI